MTKLHNEIRRWMRYVLALIMVVSFLVFPNTSYAAQPEHLQFGPSSYLPMALNNHCTGTRSAVNPFGTQLYGPTDRSQPHYKVLQNMIVPWVRTSLYWYHVEPEDIAPNEFDWSTADMYLRAATDNCANLIVTISKAPEWATTGDGESPIKSEAMPDFVQFVEAAVERYDGDGIQDAPNEIVVNYWELYNEPDGAPKPNGGGAWGDDAGRYAAMLEAVYPVITKANPNAKVVFGGLAYDLFTDEGGPFVRDFLDNVLKAGGGKFFDIMNFHYYPFYAQQTTWTDSHSSGLIEKIHAIEAKLAEYNLSKEIIITELGWHSNSSIERVSSQDFQARRVVQLMTQAMSEGIKLIIWWPFVDDLTYPFNSGLVTSNYQPKLSYTAYKVAMQRLGSATNIKVVVAATKDNDLEVYESRMAGNGKLQFVAWLNPIVPYANDFQPPFDDSVTQTWQAPGNKATIYAKDGTLLQSVTDDADGTTDGKITIAVGRNPIYIEID